MGDVADAVDVVVSNDRRISALAGRISLAVDHWSIENYNRYLAMRVIDGSGHGLRDLPAPSASGDRRCIAVVDWPSARIELRLSATERIEMVVTSATIESPVASLRLQATETLPSASLDRTKLYFRTLLVLCERRLRDASSVVAPTDAEICARLRSTGLDPIANEKMVERRLVDARRHLGLSPDDLARERVPKSSLRALLIDTAVATGAVRSSDLAAAGLVT